jgi:hypothetical protein
MRSIDGDSHSTHGYLVYMLDRQKSQLPAGQPLAITNADSSTPNSCWKLTVLQATSFQGSPGFAVAAKGESRRSLKDTSTHKTRSS